MDTMDTKIPRWRTIIAIVIVLTCWMVFDWHRFVAAFWPLDRSNVGANLLASLVQWAIILTFIALLWPPIYRRVNLFTAIKLEPILHRLDDHIENQHLHNVWMARHLAKIVRDHDGEVAPHPLYTLDTSMTTPSPLTHSEQRGFEHKLTVAPAPGGSADYRVVDPEHPLVWGHVVGVGTGERCDGYNARNAVRCSESRGLRKYSTEAGVRYYCHHHVDQAGPKSAPMGGVST